MSITKASVVAFIEKAWNESAKGASTTDYDAAIQAALDDISKTFEILKDTQASQSLAAGGYEITHPSDLIPGGLVAITLVDANGKEYLPLDPMPCGLREYRYCRDQSVSQSRPEMYVDANEDAKWFVYPPSDTTYTVRIDYYKTHAQSVETITLPDICALALKVYATYWEAVLRGNSKYQATWEQHYLKQRMELGGHFPGQVRGVYQR